MLFAALLFHGALVAAQSSSPSVVCVAGQCIQGTSNTTIGVTASSSNGRSLLLLPDSYTDTTNPQLLHDTISSSSVSYKASPGFENATTSRSLPLNVALEPGLAVYTSALYSGSASFTSLPTTSSSGNTSTPLTGSSISLASNVWASVSAGSERFVLWDSVPDLSHLPSSASSAQLSLLQLQSSACSTPCAGAGLCSPSGTCVCPPNFNGTSCETCAPGHFGPTCQECSADCKSCDEGISGTGRCLETIPDEAPSKCECANGKCEADGSCTCNQGFESSGGALKCSTCAAGFFLTEDGDCRPCAHGCTDCADGSGTCLSCTSPLTLNAERTACVSTPSASCNPVGFFEENGECRQCSSVCRTCTGSTSNDCSTCADGSYFFGNSCVRADQNGVCEGSNGMVADNLRQLCIPCGAKCTSCRIPSFTRGSSLQNLQCTGCLAGTFLSEGKCIDKCPAGTFVDRDGFTCKACDSACGTCSGSATFCLTCSSSQLASNGKCVTSCPSNTVEASGACNACHPDCATCTGSSFSQCASCPVDRPVLNNGRCVATCSKNQFFDRATSSCQSCDAGCSSCSGAGPSRCLACANSNQVLRSGSCVEAPCASSGSKVIAGLGVCLSELVVVPTGTKDEPPVITGIDAPTTLPAPRRSLEWWQILLMTLGCAFIFLMFLMCWRRRARKQRAKRTALFATAKNLEHKSSWRWRLVRFGEKLFGHRASKRVYPQQQESEDIKLMKMREAEEARSELDMDNFIGAYQYSRHSRADSLSSRAPSTLPPLNGPIARSRTLREEEDRLRRASSRLSGPSMYSQVTGMPRRAPEPRQPVNKDLLTTARFSGTSYGASSVFTSGREAMAMSRGPSDAEAYKMAVKASKEPLIPQLTPGVGHSRPEDVDVRWLEPNVTGGSKNPFRRL